HSGLGGPLHLWQTLRFSCLQPLCLAPLRQEAVGHLRALLNPCSAFNQHHQHPLMLELLGIKCCRVLSISSSR
ncbi:hypothetical protein CIB84_017238, partial [Bambusicola thoracicus]